MAAFTLRHVLILNRMGGLPSGMDKQSVCRIWERLGVAVDVECHADEG